MDHVVKIPDRYEIIEEVGAGGLGVVYKAIDRETGMSVAIKMLHQKYQTNRRFLGLFHKELLIVSQLKHRNIVRYLDSNFEPPNCYIVSEFIDGWSLRMLIKKFPKMPPLVALSIAIDILQGIDYLHLHDTIHSDLSTANVLIDRSGRVLVTDFGLSFQDSFEDYKTHTVGTPGYHSPEHITETPISEPSDLYCVGLILFEMLTGLKAIAATKDPEIELRSMKSINFRAIQSSDRRLRSKLRHLIKKSLRFQVFFRTKSSEKIMLEIYKLLNQYNIRYTKYCLRQFLIDNHLSDEPLKLSQDIYQGFSAAPHLHQLDLDDEESEYP